MTVALLLGVIGLLLVLRVPVAFAFLGPGLAYLVLTDQSRSRRWSATATPGASAWVSSAPRR